MPKRYPTEQRVRVTRMAVDRLDEYGSAWGVAKALGPKLGVGPETLRKWVLQAQVDSGGRPGPSSEELAEIKRLKKENADLRGANARNTTKQPCEQHAARGASDCSSGRSALGQQLRGRFLVARGGIGGGSVRA